MSERFSVVDVWIAILIVLMILGHCMFHNVPHWYLGMHERIYSFHMADFYFLSDFLVCHSYHRISSLSEYLAYVKKRLLKFGMPFCSLELFSVSSMFSSRTVAFLVLFQERGFCFLIPSFRLRHICGLLLSFSNFTFFRHFFAI